MSEIAKWRIPSDRERRCRCGRRAGEWSTEILRAQGWRLFDGPSMTGKELHLTVCPWCAGTTDAVDPDTDWRVGCSSCDWLYDPDDDEERGDRTEPLTKAEAQELAADHWCIPQTWVEAPRRTRVELQPNNLSLLDLVAS